MPSNQKNSKMNSINMEAFNIVGISTKTSNQNYQAATDIQNLWDEFQNKKIAESTPNKVDENIYAIYTDYEGDHNQPYTILIGSKVESLNDIPKNLIGRKFKKANYLKFSPEGKLPEAVIEQWVKIWNSDIKRAYTADLEIYKKNSKDPENPLVDILIAI